MSVYGYDRETTPYMKKWAKSASLFMRTKSESSYTGATVPSLITGKRTWTHGKYHHDLAAKPFNSKTENIALLLKEKGYHNSVFMVNDLVSVTTLDIADSIDFAPLVIEFQSPRSIEGLIEKYLFLLFGDIFSTYNWLGQDDFVFTVLLRRIDRKVYLTEFPTELAFDRFLELTDNNTHEPFFAWIHLMPPHAAYAPPEPFAGTFNQSWEMREKNEMYRYNPQINRLHENNQPFPEDLVEKIKLLRDYYDEFILYCDKMFENFIWDLEKRNLLDNTIIIISSDHGESFYEHDYFQHGSPHLYEQVTHIPLIIKEPNQTEGRVIDDLVEQVDIPATILGLVNIPVPSWMEGRSLVPYLRGEKLTAKAAISTSLYKNVPTEPIVSTGTIAVWQDDYKMIHYLDDGRSLLFNLKNDPDELVNLVNKEPGVAKRLLDIIKSNLKAANEKIMEGK
jgi:arylsulfatase A-like enzyme